MLVEVPIVSFSVVVFRVPNYLALLPRYVAARQSRDQVALYVFVKIIQLYACSLHRAQRLDACPSAFSRLLQRGSDLGGLRVVT